MLFLVYIKKLFPVIQEAGASAKPFLMFFRNSILKIPLALTAPEMIAVYVPFMRAPGSGIYFKTERFIRSGRDH
jgi:hypothetical protein